MEQVKIPSLCNAVIEKAVAFLLVFMPLAFGTVQDWAVGIMEAAAFVILGAWLIKMAFTGRIEAVKTPLVYLTAILVAVVLLQLVPLPSGIVGGISPSTARMYDRVFGSGGWEWRTISIYPGETLEELFKLLAYAAVFFVMINCYKTKKQIEGVLKTIVYVACFLVLFALLQKATWNGKLFWFYDIDPSLRSRESEIWGPYINRNHFAGFMEMAVPLSAGMLLYRSGSIGRSHQRTFPRKISSFIGSNHFPQVAAWSLAVLFLGASVFMTLSRGGILAMSVSMVLLIGMARTRRSLKRKSILLVMVGLIICVSVIAASWGRISHRFEDLADTDKVQRLDVWSDAVGIIRDFPTMGTGLGTFNTIYPIYQTRYPLLRFEHAENDYIELMTDLGLAGLVVVGCLIVVYFAEVVREWQRRHDSFVKCVATGGIASCTAIAVHSLTDFNTRIPSNAMLLTVILAITYAAVFNVTKSSMPTDRSNAGCRKQVSLPGAESSHA